MITPQKGTFNRHFTQKLDSFINCENSFDPVGLAFGFILLPIFFSARHEVITKEILELDTWENQWNVVAVNVLMHDNYDVCLVARLNPRDLIPPPSDLVEP